MVLLYKFNRINDENFLIVEQAPESVKSDMNDLTTNIRKNFDSLPRINHTLAGLIKNEYPVTYPPSFIDFLHSILKQYENQILEIHSDRLLEGVNFDSWQLGGIEEAADWNKHDGWVNFQAKGEYNPPHVHSGLLSFVYWEKIPFSSNSEWKAGFDFKTTNRVISNGGIYFQFPMTKSKIEIIQTHFNNKWEGHLALFPNYLTHGVNPFFSSDEYRVSYSGNIIVRKPSSLI